MGSTGQPKGALKIKQLKTVLNPAINLVKFLYDPYNPIILSGAFLTLFQ